MPKNRRTRNTPDHSDSEDDKANHNKMLETILKEVRGIKTQNESFREETKKELEEIRTEIRKRDDKWDNDKTVLQDKITSIENKVETKINNIETRLQEIAEAEEKRQKQERRNNIIIKNAETEETKSITVQEEVNKILETLETDVNYDDARRIGKDWRGRNMILVRITNFEDKLKVLRNKKKLEGKDCFIENDMTKEERQIQAKIRIRAKEEIAKGNTVKIGYQKLQINEKWEYYNNATKNEQKNKMLSHQWNRVAPAPDQRRRTL